MDKRDLWEKEMEDMIRTTGEKLSVPESLQPESIRQNLLEKKKSVRKRRIRKMQRLGAAAAVVLVVCGCGIAWSVSSGRLSFSGGGTSENHLAEKTVDSYQETVSNTSTEDQDAEQEKLSYAKNYQEVTTILQEMTERYADRDGAFSENYGTATGAEEDNLLSVQKNTPSDAVQESESTSSASHSETNVSVEGIMEADQVITDGEYTACGRKGMAVAA